MAFFFFGADGDAYRRGDLDPMDPAVWRGCMPNLGHGIQESAVRADAESGGMDLPDFLAEYLSIEDIGRVVQWRTIRQETWTDLHDPMSEIEGRPAIGIEMSEDRRSAWISAVGKREDGHYHMEVLEPGMAVPADVEGVDWVLPAAVDIAKAQKAWAVVVDPRRPAGSLTPKLELALKLEIERKRMKVLTPSMNAIAGACGSFYDATGNEVSTSDTGVRIYHLGQPELDTAVANARTRFTQSGGTEIWDRRDHKIDISPLVACSGAFYRWGLLKPDPTPQIHEWPDEEEIAQWAMSD